MKKKKQIRRQFSFCLVVDLFPILAEVKRRSEKERKLRRFVETYQSDIVEIYWWKIVLHVSFSSRNKLWMPTVSISKSAIKSDIDAAAIGMIVYRWHAENLPKIDRTKSLDDPQFFLNGIFLFNNLYLPWLFFIICDFCARISILMNNFKFWRVLFLFCVCIYFVVMSNVGKLDHLTLAK